MLFPRHGLGNSLRGYVSAFVFAQLAARRLVIAHGAEHFKVYDLLCEAFQCGFDALGGNTANASSSSSSSASGGGSSSSSSSSSTSGGGSSSSSSGREGKGAAELRNPAVVGNVSNHRRSLLSAGRGSGGGGGGSSKDGGTGGGGGPVDPEAAQAAAEVAQAMKLARNFGRMQPLWFLEVYPSIKGEGGGARRVRLTLST